MFITPYKPLPAFSSTKSFVAPQASNLAFKSLEKDMFVRNTPKSVSFGSNKTVDYYQQNAAAYFDLTKVLPGMDNAYPDFLKLIPEGGKILDAGCGSGRDSKSFIDRGYQVTAFDASENLAKLASDFIGQKVLPLTFNDVKFKEEFDGVWACASLLHIPKTEIDQAISNLSDSLKHGATFYASFKYGDSESEDNKGRFFSYYNEETLQKLFAKHPELKAVKVWKSGDTVGRADQVWLNIILKKDEE